MTLDLNLEVAARIQYGESVTAPDIPPGYPNPESLVTTDCIRPADSHLPGFGLGSDCSVHGVNRSAEEMVCGANPGCAGRPATPSYWLEPRRGARVDEISVGPGGTCVVRMGLGGSLALPGCIAVNALRGNGTEAHSLQFNLRSTLALRSPPF